MPKPFPSFDRALGVAGLQQDSSKDGKKAQVNTGMRHSCYHPGLGGEGSGSPVRSYAVTVWDESQVAWHAQVHGDLVIQLREPLLHCLLPHGQVLGQDTEVSLDLQKTFSKTTARPTWWCLQDGHWLGLRARTCTRLPARMLITPR